MSLFDYEQSKVINREDYSFYALIMAAMRQADSDNIVKLMDAFPDVWSELRNRYNTPWGILPGDRV